MTLILGASSGFGLALANDLAANGHPVVGAARSARPTKGEFPYRRADVRDDDSIRALADGVTAGFGPITGLVYSVSNTSAVGHAWQLDASEVIDVVDVSFIGFVRVLRLVAPGMLAAGGGSIVVIGSRAARVPVPTLAGYAAAKAALEHYVRCVAEELQSGGVRINTIGFSGDTELARRHLELRARVLGRTEPYPALPDVADSVPCARFLLSPAARFVTGQTIEARQPLWT
ncbi:SDR family oxidoreductase [Actinoplanes sp. NPDC026670]|uniref:SDR family NAD(P)-dependent oxidoreductase n=1 Tax=Actinoplanes sp. NPDC026670 TaxID=3154700 RepID=UPI0033DE265A